MKLKIFGIVLCMLFLCSYAIPKKQEILFKRNWIPEQSITLDKLLPSAKKNSCFTISEVRDYIAKGNTLKLAYFYSEQIGCPVSVFLAQDILESRLRKSNLTKKTGNHGNIKCRIHPHFLCKKKCVRGYDKIEKSWSYYITIGTDWESWQRKAKILKNYKACKKARNSCTEGYVNWSKIFHDSPYATDKNYDKKLIKIIHQYGLNYIDEAIKVRKVIKTSKGGKYELLNPNVNYWN